MRRIAGRPGRAACRASGARAMAAPERKRRRPRRRRRACRDKGGGRCRRSSTSPERANRMPAMAAVIRSPLCRKPERLAPTQTRGQHLHLRREARRLRLSRGPGRPTVLLPERFRVVSPSAAARAALSRKPVKRERFGTARAIKAALRSVIRQVRHASTLPDQSPGRRIAQEFRRRILASTARAGALY